MPYYGPRVNLPKQYDPTGTIIKAFQRIEEKPLREAREEYADIRNAVAQRKLMSYGVMPPGYEAPQERPDTGGGAPGGGERTGRERTEPSPSGGTRPRAGQPERRQPASATMPSRSELEQAAPAGPQSEAGPASSFGDALENAAAQVTGGSARATPTPGRSSGGAGRVPPEERGLPPGDVRAPMGTDPDKYTEQLAGTFTGSGGRRRAPASDTILPTDHDMTTIRRGEGAGGSVSPDTIELYGGYTYQGEREGVPGWLNIYTAFRDAGEDITPAQAQTIWQETAEPGDYGFGEEGADEFPPFNPTDAQLDAVIDDPRLRDSLSGESPGARYEAFMEHMPPAGEMSGELMDNPRYREKLNHAAIRMAQYGDTPEQAIESAEQEFPDAPTVSAGEAGLWADRLARGSGSYFGGRGRPTSQLGRHLFHQTQIGQMSTPEAVDIAQRINLRRQEVQRLKRQQGLSQDEAVNRVAEEYNLSSSAMEWLDDPPLDQPQMSDLINYLSAAQRDPRESYERIPLQPGPRY